MRGRAAGQGAHHVAAFQAGDDAPVCVLAGHFQQPLGHPLVVGIDQTQVAHVVLAVRVKACGNVDELGAEGLQRGNPGLVHQRAELGAAGAAGHSDMHHVAATGLLVLAQGVEAFFKDGAHQHAVVAIEDVGAAVAVVHIKVDQSHPREAMHIQGMADADGHVVEEAKPHAGGAFGMVARRAHIAERGVHLAADHQIGGQHGRAGRTQGRLHGVGVHEGVGVHALIAFAGRAGQHLVHVQRGMGAPQLFLAGQWGVVGHHEIGVALGEQHVGDGVQALRALGVARAHFMFEAIRMGNVGGQHGDRLAMMDEPPQKALRIADATPL